MARMSAVTKIGPGGRIVLPAAFRRELDLNVGDEVIVRVDGREIRVLTYAESIRQAQERVRPYLAHGDVVAELLAERRAEAERE